MTRAVAPPPLRPDPADPPTAVVFDIGNVLIRWDPRRLYRKLLPDEAAVDRFLSTVCTREWNDSLDRGRPYGEAVAALSRQHPQHADLIAAYRDRWDEMIGGVIGGTVELLGELQGAGVPCFALTNFSTEKWAVTYRRYPFLARFDGVVVSGREGLAKPDLAIYRRLASRYRLEPAATVFTDDSPANVTAARISGFRALRFASSAGLRADLRRLGLPV